jgi:hypothetical protein
VQLAAVVFGTRLYARWVDASNRYEAIIGADGALTVNRRVAGTATPVVGAPAGTFAASDTGVFKIRVRGNVITAYKDGAIIATYTDENGSALAASTRVGVGSPSTSSSWALDNLVVTDR